MNYLSHFYWHSMLSKDSHCHRMNRWTFHSFTADTQTATQIFPSVNLKAQRLKLLCSGIRLCPNPQGAIISADRKGAYNLRYL